MERHSLPLLRVSSDGAKKKAAILHKHLDAFMRLAKAGKEIIVRIKVSSHALQNSSSKARDSNFNLRDYRWRIISDIPLAACTLEWGAKHIVVPTARTSR